MYGAFFNDIIKANAKSQRSVLDAIIFGILCHLQGGPKRKSLPSIIIKSY